MSVSSDSEEEFRLAPIGATEYDLDDWRNELRELNIAMKSNVFPPEEFKEMDAYRSELMKKIADLTRAKKAASKPSARILEEFNRTHEITPAGALKYSTAAARAAKAPSTRRLLGNVAGLSKDVHPKYLPGRT